MEIYKVKHSLTGYKPTKRIQGNILAVTGGSYNFDYTIKATDDAKLIVFNLVGRKVGEYNLDPTHTTMKVNSVNLPAGMYFYKVTVNQKPTASDKFVIVK